MDTRSQRVRCSIQFAEPEQSGCPWSRSETCRAKGKVIAALAPVCADKFRALPDAEAKQVALSKVDSWKRQDEFPKEFVTLPGESYPSSALVDACYTLLLAPKSAALK